MISVLSQVEKRLRIAAGTELPSAHGIGNPVILALGTVAVPASVLAVKFTEAKVFYSLAVYVGYVAADFAETAGIEVAVSVDAKGMEFITVADVDSVFVTPMALPGVPTQPTENVDMSPAPICVPTIGDGPAVETPVAVDAPNVMAEPLGETTNIVAPTDDHDGEHSSDFIKGQEHYASVIQFAGAAAALLSSMTDNEKAVALLSAHGDAAMQLATIAVTALTEKIEAQAAVAATDEAKPTTVDGAELAEVLAAADATVVADAATDDVATTPVPLTISEIEQQAPAVHAEVVEPTGSVEITPPAAKE